MDWANFLFSFQGRISPAAYWVFFLVTTAIHGVALLVGGVSVDPKTEMPSFTGWFWLLLLLLLWPSLAVQAKRWHDQDKSAWWILINLVPFMGWPISLILCGFIAGTPGPNRFGEGPMA